MSPQQSPFRRRLRNTIAMLSLLATMTLLVAGCGRAKYERRLQKTVELAKYREKLNKNLSSNWNSKKGVQIRVPRQFSEIRLPRPKKLEEGEEPPEEEIVDPRQPTFMSEPLPGLVGAWTAEVNLVVGKNESARKAPAYLYVLSNYELLTQPGQGEEALTFNTNIAPITIVDGLNAKLPEQAEWISETHPRGEGFVEKKRLTAAIVKSIVQITMPAEKSPEEGEASTDSDDAASESLTPANTEPQVVELPVNCKMYLAENKDNQVMVLLILPEQIDPRENLSLDTLSEKGSRIAMCLETLAVSSRKPKVKVSGEAKNSDGGGRAGGF